MKKDKLFFFAAATAKEDLLVEPGEVAEFVLDDTSTQQTLKLDWSINPSNTLTAHYRHEDLEIGEPGGSGSLKTNPGHYDIMPTLLEYGPVRMIRSRTHKYVHRYP